MRDIDFDEMEAQHEGGGVPLMKDGKPYAPTEFRHGARFEFFKKVKEARARKRAARTSLPSRR